MARYLGEVVHYTPHAEHFHLHDQPEYAAVVGRIRPDGNADLMVFPPNQAPVWVDDVPPGDAHHTHRSIKPAAVGKVDEAIALMGSLDGKLHAHALAAEATLAALHAQVNELHATVTALSTPATAPPANDAGTDPNPPQGA